MDPLSADSAAVATALGHPPGLVLLARPALGERRVEQLADSAALGMSTCSAQLQALRSAGLVTTRREGKHVHYSLAGGDVVGLWEHLLRVAQHHRPHTEVARRAYLGPEDTEALDTGELLHRLGTDEAVVLDVRPLPEYAGGHLPGALHIPLDELADRVGELPRDREIIAYCRGRYCAMAHDAVRLLTAHGLTARRATDGVLEWRLAGVAVETGVA
jgi:rhodanese-related sulfurtransferase/DNA-binding transcriptional ArsR family regulator